VGCYKGESVTADNVRHAIASSDDFQKYEDRFVNSTLLLVNSGTCNLGELQEQGGWYKSVINHKNQLVYFIYCGGLHRDNRIYLNIESGNTFR